MLVRREELGRNAAREGPEPGGRGDWKAQVRSRAAEVEYDGCEGKSIGSKVASPVCVKHTTCKACAELLLLSYGDMKIT